VFNTGSPGALYIRTNTGPALAAGAHLVTGREREAHTDKDRLELQQPR
jgi:hypothetical protein